MSWIEMTARYNGSCCKCINRVYPGQRIFWNNNGSHKVKHTVHGNENRDNAGGIGGGKGPSFSGGIIVGGGDIPTRSLIDISKDSDFQRRKEMRENLRECYN